MPGIQAKPTLAGGFGVKFSHKGTDMTASGPRGGSSRTADNGYVGWRNGASKVLRHFRALKASRGSQKRILLPGMPLSANGARENRVSDSISRTGVSTRLQSWAIAVTGTFCLAVGVAVLLGWALDISILK